MLSFSFTLPGIDGFLLSGYERIVEHPLQIPISTWNSLSHGGKVRLHSAIFIYFFIALKIHFAYFVRIFYPISPTEYSMLLIPYMPSDPSQKTNTNATFGIILFSLSSMII